MNIPLDEVVYFDCVTSDPTTGEVSDADSTPTFEVFEESTDTDIGVGGNLTNRTSKTGNYRGSFTASAANGFEVGKWYSVIGSATVGGAVGKAVLKSFRVVAAETAAGYPVVDAGKVGGQTASAAGTVTFPGTIASTTNITAAAGITLADNAITAAKIADGAIDAATFASGALDAVWSSATRTLTGFSFNVTLATSQPNYAPAKAGDAMTLTSGERTAVANAVEAEIIDETDSEKVLTAITDKIASVNPSLGDLTLSAIAAAVRDVANTSPTANSLGAAVKAAADRMPGSGTLATTADVPTVSAIAAQITTDHGTGSYVRNTEPPSASTISGQVASDLAAAHGAGSWATATGFATVNADNASIAAILEDTGTTIPAQISALSIPSAASIAAAVLAAGDVDGFSLEQTLKLCLAALAGKLSGAATTTITIRAADDSKARITATVDADGNRSAITLDAAG